MNVGTARVSDRRGDQTGGTQVRIPRDVLVRVHETRVRRLGHAEDEGPARRTSADAVERTMVVVCFWSSPSGTGLHRGLKAGMGN